MLSVNSLLQEFSVSTAFFCFTSLQGPDAVCLADYCTEFRCDVTMGWVTPTFWDYALCIEDDMLDMAANCLVRHVNNKIKSS